MVRRARAAISRFAPQLMVVALLALVLLSSAPAGAQDGDQGPLELLEEPPFGAPDPNQPPFPNDFPEGFPDIADMWDPILSDAALAELFLEIALLDHLDAFTAAPPEFVSIRNAYSPWPADASREDVAELLKVVDRRLAEIKNDINDVIGPVPSLARPLDEISQNDMIRIIDGVTDVVPSGPYVGAVHDLLTLGDAAALREIGELQSVVDEILPLALADLADSADIAVLHQQVGDLQNQNAVIQTRLDALDGGEGGNGSPWLTILAIAGVGLLAGVVLTMLLLRRRRGGRPPANDRITEQIFEAHRRLSGALDEDHVAEIGTATAAQITDSLDAMVFRVADDGIRRTGQDNVITRSALMRVVETAQPLMDEVVGDAAAGTAAVCVVPLVSDSMMTGILAVRRELDRPYDNDDRHQLELLAPARGGALLSADQLDSFENLAMVDGLTSLGNRRRLDGDLETALASALANDLPVAFAMIDVDHFKQFNDTHGHEAGEFALQTVARVIERHVRASDIVYRYGGEEFSVLLPGATVEEARQAGERMRAAIEHAGIAGGESQPGGCLTISVGISTLESGPAEELKSRADEALYEAKAAGRNRSILA